MRWDGFRRPVSMPLNCASWHLTNSGPIDVKADGSDRLVPTTAQYLVELTPIECRSEGRPVSHVESLVIEGRSESVIGRLLRSIAAVAVRESGFLIFSCNNRTMFFLLGCSACITFA